jgi:hypothetical protein
MKNCDLFDTFPTEFIALDRLKTERRLLIFDLNFNRATWGVRVEFQWVALRRFGLEKRTGGVELGAAICFLEEQAQHLRGARV